MWQEERYQRIRLLLSKMQRVSTDRIMADLNVSRETVRRDLVDLEALGELKRVHGGAVQVGDEAPIAERAQTHVKAKLAIARGGQAGRAADAVHRCGHDHDAAGRGTGEAVGPHDRHELDRRRAEDAVERPGAGEERNDPARRDDRQPRGRDRRRRHGRRDIPLPRRSRAAVTGGRRCRARRDQLRPDGNRSGARDGQQRGGRRDPPISASSARTAGSASASRRGSAHW